MKCFPVLILVTVFVFTAGLLRADDIRADNKKELQRIKREMRAKKSELKRADRKERSILVDLEEIDREIQAGKADLAEHQRRLREAESSLREVEKSNVEISADLARLKQAYGRRLRALYKMSKNGYSVGLAAFGGDGDTLRKIKYLGLMAERDRVVIRDYSDALRRLTTREAEISEKKQTLLESKRATEFKKEELEARKRRKAALLAGIRERKSLYEQTLQELEEASASLWAMIKQSEQQRAVAKRPKPPSPPIVRDVEGRERFPWPVNGRVLTQFGMQRHPQFKTMVFRRGIEIEAREGAPVTAVSGGQVVYADWYRGYGKLIIMEHGPDFYTLYGNLSRTDANKGDRVLKGQVIGLAGETGSLKGSNLYFEVRRNGEAQDPLLWLAKR